MIKGIGSIIAAIVSAPAFESFNGDYILFTGLLGIASILFLLPFTASIYQLYTYFFLLGFFSAINDTGCNILVRRKHGRHAGPWLSANGIAFGSSAAIVPLINLITEDFTLQNWILGCLVLIIASLLMFGSSRSANLDEEDKLLIALNEREVTENLKDQQTVDSIAPHYRVEWLIGLVVFSVCGIQVTAASYLITYLDQSGGINMTTASKQNILFLFWCFWSVGRVLGVMDQRNANMSDATLLRHLTVCLSLSSAAVFSMLIIPPSALSIGISVALFALFHGPTNGMCLDLNNRLTLPTEKSTSILMFGINCGDSFVPFIVAIAWRYNHNSPKTLLYFMFFCMFVPALAMQSVLRLSYKTSVDNFECQRERSAFYYQAVVYVYTATRRASRRLSRSLMQHVLGVPSDWSPNKSPTRSNKGTPRSPSSLDSPLLGSSILKSSMDIEDDKTIGSYGSTGENRI